MNASLIWDLWDWIHEWRFFQQIYPSGSLHLNENIAFQIYEQQCFVEQQAQMQIYYEMQGFVHMENQENSHSYERI